MGLGGGRGRSTRKRELTGLKLEAEMKRLLDFIARFLEEYPSPLDVEG